MTDMIINQPDTAANALTKSLEAPALDPIILAIANDNLSGSGIPEIAEKYNISNDLVVQVLEKKEVKNYVDTVLLNHGYLHRAKRLKLIQNVIEQKVKEAVETGMYSKKDLLDWLKHLNEIEQGIKPKQIAPSVAIQVNNNYDNLMRDLMSNEKS